MIGVIRAALVLVLTALAAACSIDRRSDDLRCENQGDCGPDRTCTGGWCVAGEDPSDAGVDALDGAACPAACTRCETGSCIIECNETDACAAPIVCPAGLPCVVRCGGANACAGGITCSTSRCDVTCTGNGSCDGDIDCRDACACTTSCTGNGACNQSLIECPGPGFCTQGGQCVNQPSQCDRC